MQHQVCNTKNLCSPAISPVIQHSILSWYTHLPHPSHCQVLHNPTKHGFTLPPWGSEALRSGNGTHTWQSWFCGTRPLLQSWPDDPRSWERASWHAACYAFSHRNLWTHSPTIGVILVTPPTLALLQRFLSTIHRFPYASGTIISRYQQVSWILTIEVRWRSFYLTTASSTWSYVRVTRSRSWSWRSSSGPRWSSDPP